MDLELKGKNVFVSGGGKGLGAAIGLAFAAEGANVAFHYANSASGAEQAVEQAEALGVKAVAVGADLRDGDAVDSAVATAVDELGHIDVLVNNAAVTQSKPFLESSEEDWAPQVDVTVTGTLRMTQAVLKHMVDAGIKGNVVSLMGDSGRVGESRLLVTATARSTTVGLTKSLAKEMARHGIRANAVSIALVQTQATSLADHTGDADKAKMERILKAYPLRRFGTPDDVTPTILLLASSRSSWTTGQIVSVNGGYSMP